MQETTLMHLEGLAGQGRAATVSMGSPAALVRRQARAAFQRVQWRGTGVRSEDLRAFAELIDEAERRRVERQAPLRREEFDELAERIRLSWPEEGRPHRDYHRLIVRASQSLPLEEAVSASVPAPVENTRPWHELPDCPAVLAAEAAEAGEYRRRELGVHRSCAWNLFAEALQSVPKAVPGTLTRALKRRTINTVEGAGRTIPELAEAGVRRMTVTDLEPPELALLAPFRIQNVDFDKAERVFAVLADHIRYADRLWHSAVNIAARPASSVAGVIEQHHDP